MKRRSLSYNSRMVQFVEGEGGWNKVHSSYDKAVQSREMDIEKMMSRGKHYDSALCEHMNNFRLHLPTNSPGFGHYRRLIRQLGIENTSYGQSMESAEELQLISPLKRTQTPIQFYRIIDSELVRVGLDLSEIMRMMDQRVSHSQLYRYVVLAFDHLRTKYSGYDLTS